MHVDQIRARLNPETVVPVVTPADSEKPTEESTPQSDFPAAKLRDSPSLPNDESTESESPSACSDNEHSKIPCEAATPFRQTLILGGEEM